MGALTGIVVLDVSQVMAGPYCAMQLADLGADVIKIEPPSGDATRGWSTGAAGGDSPEFNAVNRGKRSVVLNLKSAAARDVFRRLVRRADIVVENFRPGVMAAFALDYPALQAENPRLIYASISGYGQTGPDARKGGFDLVAQGMSGIMSITGAPGEPPVKCGVPVTDLGAGLFALVGILAALVHRAQTGVGQHVDTSLLDVGIALSVWEATEYLSGRGIPQPTGSAHRLSAPYQAIRCADGYITVGAANDRLFGRLCAALDQPEWALRSEFATPADRVRARKLLADLIENVTVTAPRRHWLDRLDAFEVPCGPINDYEAVMREPQVLARQMVCETEHPTLGRLRTIGSPLKLSSTPAQATARAPLLGEHTSEVLRDAGYSDDEIEGLRGAAALGSLPDPPGAEQAPG